MCLCMREARARGFPGKFMRSLCWFDVCTCAQVRGRPRSQLRSHAPPAHIHTHAHTPAHRVVHTHRVARIHTRTPAHTDHVDRGPSFYCLAYVLWLPHQLLIPIVSNTINKRTFSNRVRPLMQSDCTGSNSWLLIRIMSNTINKMTFPNKVRPLMESDCTGSNSWLLIHIMSNTIDKKDLLK